MVEMVKQLQNIKDKKKIWKADKENIDYFKWVAVHLTAKFAIANMEIRK